MTKPKLTRWQMAYGKQPIVDLNQPNQITEHGVLAALSLSDSEKISAHFY